MSSGVLSRRCVAPKGAKPTRSLAYYKHFIPTGLHPTQQRRTCRLATPDRHLKKSAPLFASEKQRRSS